MSRLVMYSDGERGKVCVMVRVPGARSTIVDWGSIGYKDMSDRFRIFYVYIWSKGRPKPSLAQSGWSSSSGSLKGTIALTPST